MGDVVGSLSEKNVDDGGIFVLLWLWELLYVIYNQNIIFEARGADTRQYLNKDRNTMKKGEEKHCLRHLCLDYWTIMPGMKNKERPKDSGSQMIT